MALRNGKMVAAQARRYRVLEMKMSGATDRQIAEVEDVSVATINKDVKKALGDMARDSESNADELRNLQMERYNRLLLRNWPGALAGDKEASDRVLRILGYINQICGLIPDKPMITMNMIQQNMEFNNGPVTFTIEAASDNQDTNLPETPAIPETTAGNILDG